MKLFKVRKQFEKQPETGSNNSRERARQKRRFIENQPFLDLFIILHLADHTKTNKHKDFGGGVDNKIPSKTGIYVRSRFRDSAS